MPEVVNTSITDLTNKTMNRSIKFFTLGLFLFTCSIAQEAQKNLRFGIKFAPSINWLNPENDKKIKNDGMVIRTAIGLITEFRLTDVASFSTGIDYMLTGGKTSYNGSDIATYFYKDDAITEITIKDGLIASPNYLSIIAPNSGYKRYSLVKRNYRIGYIHIPLCFKLKTKDIGGFTYFGQIGGNVFIRTKGKADDDVLEVSNGTGIPAAVTIKNVDIAKQVSLVNLGVNVGLGAEYNLSGSTSAFISLHYLHAMFNTTKSESNYLLKASADPNQPTLENFNYFPNVLKNRQVVLSVGVLF